MKIVIYNPHTNEWSDFINSLNGVKYPERDKLINQHIEEIGTEITPKQFYDNVYHYTGWSCEERFEFIGEPETVFEKVLKYIYDSTSYIHMSQSFPEDMVESRTDWDDMRDYADDMARFIEDIADELSKKEN